MNPIGQLPLNLATIAADNTVNIAERAAGFQITGDTGNVQGSAVTVTVGSQELTATSSATGAWSVSVTADAAYIAGTSVSVAVAATRTGYTDANTVSRSLAVDLVAPSTRTWTAPATLRVGVPITTINPSTSTDADIASFSAAGLPAGLGIDAQTGAISGTPTAYSASGPTVTITITDDAGNATDVSVALPQVSRASRT